MAMSNGNSEASEAGSNGNAAGRVVVDVVENSQCMAQGLDMPDTFQSCGNEPCPHWTKGEWTLCQQSRCHGRNTAVQRREVSCRYENGTAGSACDEYEKPPARQECYNERCKGVWRVEPWSEVGTSLSPFHRTWAHLLLMANAIFFLFLDSHYTVQCALWSARHKIPHSAVRLVRQPSSSGQCLQTPAQAGGDEGVQEFPMPIEA